ncbi:MAG TPA: peptidoglycan-binding protein, partial [Opitutaceae bacterium]
TAANESLATLSQDLVPGSHGNAVEQVHAYLTRYGYFPNSDLAQRYPTWSPIVAQPPASASVYDAQTTAAVTAFQAAFSLPQTGMVDQATRAAMLTPRYDSIPEGLARFDPADKFDDTNSFVTAPFNWSFGGGSAPGLTSAQTESAAVAALAEWQNVTSFTASKVPSGGIITVGIGSCANAADESNQPVCTFTLMGQVFPRGTITINSTAASFTTTSLQAALRHAFGHALGLFHSAFPAAAMFPTFNTADPPLNIDDKISIGILYDKWQQLPNGGTDIAVGAEGSVWIVGGGAQNVFKFNGTTWVQDASLKTAKAITVDSDGVPWIVGTDNHPYEYSGTNPATGTWQDRIGSGSVSIPCASDIGAGADGSVWAISCLGSTDHPIYKHTRNILMNDVWTQTTSNGAGIRIAVSPTGNPWVTNTAGQISRLSTNDPTTGTWGLLPGLAKDIGIAPVAANNNNYAWSIGTSPVGPSDFGIFAWDEQPGDAGSPPIRQINGVWLNTAGGATRISVDASGKPWIINSAGSIFKRVK